MLESQCHRNQPNVICGDICHDYAGCKICHAVMTAHVTTLNAV
jgi:hypothetical protein